MRRAAIAVMTMLAALVLASCNDRAPAPVGQLDVDGSADVTEGGRTSAVGPGTLTLHGGDQVSVTSGRATLSLGGERQLELREGTVVALAAGATDANPAADLIGGDVLVISRTVPATVTAAGTEVSVVGLARVSRALAVVVTAYEGTASVTSAGRALAVPALRQLSVAAAGLLPARPSPLSFDPSDLWDQRYLGDAIDLGNQLVSRSRGLTNQLAPGEGRSPGFYRILLPGLEGEPEFEASLIDPDRAPGETLVGAAIAVEGLRGGFAERWRAVFAFHDAGAAWGLVALDQGVTRSALISRVDSALALGPGAAPARPTPTVPPAGTPPTTVASQPPPTSPPTGSIPAPEGPAPTTPVATSPPATPGPTVPIERVRGINLGAPIVDDTLNGLVATLGGLLRGLSGT